jgi:hypothetical protein
MIRSSIFAPVLALSVTTVMANSGFAQPVQLSNVVIYPSDLPGNFQEASPKELAEIKRRMIFGSELIVQSFFQLYQLEFESLEVQIVMGATFWIADEFIEKVGEEADYFFGEENFHSLVRNFLAEADENWGGLDISVTENILRNLTEIGDKAIGTKLQISMMGVLFDANLIIFQRGQVVAFTMTGHFTGNPPLISSIEVARLLDRRIQEILQAGLTP